MNLLSPALVGLLLALFATPAHATGEDDSPSEAAEVTSVEQREQVLYQRGLSLFEEGDYPRAIEIWGELLDSMGQERGHKLLYMIGRSHEEIANVTEAIGHYEAFLAITAEALKQNGSEQDGGASNDSQLSGARDAARRRMDGLKSRYGALKINAARDGVVLVRVGLGEPKPAGFTVYLAPGNHRVELHAGTGKSWQQVVRLTAGQISIVEAGTAPPEPAKAAPPPAVAPVDSPEPESTFPTGWIVAGSALTIASMAVPIALYFVAKDKYEHADRLGASHPNYQDAKNEFESFEAGYQASYAIPALFAAATLVTLTAWALDESDAAPSVSVGPGHVSLKLRF